MLNAPKILSNVASSMFEGLGVNVRDFLTVASSSDDLGHNEKRLYQNFITNFLHAIALKLKAIENDSWLREVLQATTACCEAYVSLQGCASIDKALAVPKLVYNIVITLKKQEYIEDVICLTGLLYQMLDSGAGPVLVEAHTVIRAVAACLWGLAAKLARQKNTDSGAPTDLGLYIRLWRGYFDFLCLLPNRATMIDKLRTIFSDFLPTATSQSSDNTLKLDTDCSRLICSIFESLITKMTSYLEQSETQEESLSLNLSQVRVLYVEHLLRQCDTAAARRVVEELRGNQAAAAGVYQVCLELLAGSCEYAALTDTLRHAIDATRASLAQCDPETLRLLYWTYSHFTKLTKLESVLSECKSGEFVEEVLAAYDVCLTVTTKIIEAGSAADNTNKNNSDTQDKKSSQDKRSSQDKKSHPSQDKTCDEDTSSQDKKCVDSKLVVGLLKTYLRQLQIILQVLRSPDGCSCVEELLQRGLALAREFGGWLEKNPASLPAKVLIGHRHNCGWVCSSLGNFSFRQSLYEISAQFYQMAVHQLQHCNEPRLFKFLESIVECHLQLDQLTEASQAVIQALLLTTPTGAGAEISPTLMLWYRLKKEAITRGNTMFLTMSLASMVKGAGVSVPGLTGRQLLYAEYQTCRKAARRNLVVEYHLLTELCEATTGDLGKAVVMVDLAANMRHTGYTYKDNTAGELLNKAILSLDKHADKAGAVLALAFYTKYDVTHNYVIQEQEKPPATANPSEPAPEAVDTEGHEAAAPSKPPTAAHFTLHSEQPYLPYLRRAVELWEAWFTGGGGGGRGKKKGRSSGGGEEAGAGIQVEVEHHLAALMECATRLILMKQPVLGLRAVRVAQGQLPSVTAGSQRESLHQQMARLLLLLGCYTEAQGMILPTAAAAGDQDKQLPTGARPVTRDGQPVLQAELCLMSGKKEEGVDILSRLLSPQDGDGAGPPLTPQSYLQDGTAKRLLSTLLCYPDSHRAHPTGHTHQYLLSLAFEAVRSHFSVLKSVVKNDTHDKFKTVSTDKWLLLYEVLASLLHLCQLCRFVGMPSDAQSYLREGLAISQAHGLPRWSCEFLFELLRVQSLVGDYETALQTVDLIYTVLETDGEPALPATSNLCTASDSHTVTTSPGTKQDDNQDGSPTASGESAENCFGFEDMGPVAKKTNVTPEKECFNQKLNSVCKERISGLSAPKCGCVLGEGVCEDSVRHKLCVQAGIVVADFLTQADMRPVAERLLHHSKTTVCRTSPKGNSINSLVDVILHHSSPTSTNGRLPDTQMVYTCLEGVCIEAEIYMHQNNYRAVQQIWRALSEVQTAGHLKNILHSNIAMTRLALCQVNAYMRSLNTAHMTAVADSVMGPLTEQVEQLSLTEKKVSFSDTNGLCVKGTKMKGARRKLLGSSEGMTEENPIDLCSSNTDGCRPSLDATRLKSGCVEAISTPKASRIALMQLGSKSARKERLSHMLQTPVTNRRAVLDLMIDSDEDDDAHIMFPKPKLVTPKVDRSKDLKSRRCKTEPRNKSKKTKPEPVLPNPVCKLDDLLEDSVVSPSLAAGCTNNNATEVTDRSEKDCAIVRFETDDSPNSEKSPNSKIGKGKMAVEGHKIELVEKAAGRGRGRKAAASSRQQEKPDPSIDCENIEPADKTAGRGRGRKTYARKPGKKTDIKPIPKPEEVVEASENGDSDICILKDSGRLRKIKEEETVETEVTSDNKQKKGVVRTAGKNKVSSCKESQKVNPLKPVTVNVPNPAVNGDIFDFNAEASPDVGKVVKGKTKKTKPASSSLAKTVSSSAKTKPSNKTIGKGKENVSLEKKPARPRRGRAKQEDDVIELQRNCHNDSVGHVDISYDEIPDDQCDDCIDKANEKTTTFDSVSLEIEYENAQNFLSEESHLDLHLELPDDQEFEPIEVMRSDTNTKAKQKSTRGGKRTTRGRATTAQQRNLVDEGEGYVDGAEVMRSGCPVSLESLAQKLSCVGDETEDLPEMPSVSAGGDCGLDQSAVMASLELMYGQIRHLAWYPQHPEICQALALHYIDTDPYRAAFLLSDSIAVTFRHQAMLNVGRKVRKATEQKAGSGGDSGGLACIQDGLLFDKDETCLSDMISVIPDDWVVVQLSVVSSAAAVSGQQFLLTRFVSGQNPLVVRLPGFSTPQGRQILRDFSQIMESNVSSVKIESRAKWWNTREKLNLDLQNVIESMEKFWLGAWTAAFLPRAFSQKLVTKVTRDVNKAAKRDVDPATIEMLLLCVDRLSEPQLVQCAQELLRSWSLDEVDTALTVVRKHATPDIADTSQHHVVLILDKTVQHLPWENIAALSDMSVSRVPCLPHLYTVLTYLQTQESSSSVFRHGVDPRNTYYIINPDLDLPHLEKTFKDWFEGEEGWKGTCGAKPTSEQFTEALTDRDLLIYCGHGSGGRYFGRDEIERLRARAVTLLMGCSSGKLRAKGILEPSGIMLSYFMAGCPCMVANLWDVTDKDIDKFTYDLLHSWLSAPDGARLSAQVQRSRAACKMRYLVGSAPVVYGLPVYINRKR